MVTCLAGFYENFREDVKGKVREFVVCSL